MTHGSHENSHGNRTSFTCYNTLNMFSLQKTVQWDTLLTNVLALFCRLVLYAKALAINDASLFPYRYICLHVRRVSLKMADIIVRQN